MNAKVKLTTNLGDIIIEVDEKAAPETATNFLNLVNSGFYDGTIFHRVIENFMIQGGGFTKEMEQKIAPQKISNEADNGLHNLRGSVAMARTSDPHSASSQFFINVVDNHFLNYRAKTLDGWGYCVFGKVVDGMAAVDKIKKLKTSHQHGHQDVPIDTAIIEKAIVVK